MFRIKRPIGRAIRMLGIGVLALGLLAAPAPLAAATTSGDDAPPATVATVAGTLRGDVSTLSSCAITKYGYTGYRICEFDYSYIDRGNGNIEWFVVGTNYAIYHIWPGSGGWHSLGGRARTATPNGAYAYLYGVETIGTNNYWYCRDWPWSSGWYQC
jgi:hypothetical protein